MDKSINFYKEMNELINSSWKNIFLRKTVDVNSSISPQSGYVYFIEKGEMRLHSEALSGEVFLKDYYQGDFLWLDESILGEIPNSYAVALSRVELLKFPFKEIVNLPSGQNFWKIAALKLAQNYKEFYSDEVNRVKSTTEEYIIGFLMKRNGRLKYKNQRELSDILNVNIRTLQRVIKRMQEKGLIKKTKKTLEIADNVNSFN